MPAIHILGPASRKREHSAAHLKILWPYVPHWQWRCQGRSRHVHSCLNICSDHIEGQSFYCTHMVQLSRAHHQPPQPHPQPHPWPTGCRFTSPGGGGARTGICSQVDKFMNAEVFWGVMGLTMDNYSVASAAFVTETDSTASETLQPTAQHFDRTCLPTMLCRLCPVHIAQML